MAFKETPKETEVERALRLFREYRERSMYDEALQHVTERVAEADKNTAITTETLDVKLKLIVNSLLDSIIAGNTEIESGTELLQLIAAVKGL